VLTESQGSTCRVRGRSSAVAAVPCCDENSGRVIGGRWSAGGARYPEWLSRLVSGLVSWCLGVLVSGSAPGKLGRCWRDTSGSGLVLANRARGKALPSAQMAPDAEASQALTNRAPRRTIYRERRGSATIHPKHPAPRLLTFYALQFGFQKVPMPCCPISIRRVASRSLWANRSLALSRSLTPHSTPQTWVCANVSGCGASD
jgi:hypothetical protein